MLQAAYEELGDDVAFVGINTRDASAAQGLAFERHYGVEYPSVYSPDGAAVLALKGSLAPRAIPATATTLRGTGTGAPVSRLRSGP